MTLPQSSSHLPEAARREFEKIAKSDLQDGVPLTELLDRVNRVAVHLAPEEGERDSRVKRVYSDRSFRHYQNLGCIDPAEKVGRRSVYRRRHFVQALLVRRLLWSRMPSEQIVGVLSGRSTEEAMQIFVGGIEIALRAGEGRGARESLGSGRAETWRRVQVMPGVELHLRDDLPKLGVAELKELLARLEKALRQAD